MIERIKNRNCRFFNEEKHCSILKIKTCKNCKFFKDKKDKREEELQQKFKRRNTSYDTRR